MDKWKICVITALLLSLAGYGFYQSAATTPGSGASGSAGNEAGTGHATGESAIDPEATGHLTEVDQELQRWIGRPAPAWQIPASLWANTPRPVTLKDLQGHITVIEFWRAACSHCEAAAPFMHGLFNRYTPRGVRFLGIHSPSINPDPTFVENDWGQVQGKIREWALPYPIAYDQKSILFRDSYHGKQYPTIFVLDGKGVIRYVRAGDTPGKEKALIDFLESATAPKTTAPKTTVPKNTVPKK